MLDIHSVRNVSHEVTILWYIITTEWIKYFKLKQWKWGSDKKSFDIAYLFVGCKISGIDSDLIIGKFWRVYFSNAWFPLHVLSILMSCSYGSWIYNYISNQYLSLLTLWVRISLVARCTRYNVHVMWWSLSVTCGSSEVFSGYSGFLHK